MLRTLLNLGILAHVDAGKTTLTERLLYAAGVIDTLGSVDAGTTQTDSLALERRRGITIKSAVASFPIGDVTVNLIDTPGHPDFIAEVERVLSVLDGVVLVVSGVEGVQPQTRVMMRTLERLRLPTLVFVNKLDRRGADFARVLTEIADRLTPRAIAMGSALDEGTPRARFAGHDWADEAFTSRVVDVLSEHDDELLAAYVDGTTAIGTDRLRRALAGQSQAALVHPVFAGSAITGAGVEPLASGIATLLPASDAERDGSLSAAAFKVERGAAGERIAYARIFSGTIRVRDRVRIRHEEPGDDEEGKVTAIKVFDGAVAVTSASARAGEIAKVWGLGAVRIGDAIGDRLPPRSVREAFVRPTLESVVAPRDPAGAAALYVALTQLAEQDPLIGVCRDAGRQGLRVSLYGEVQKEVIEATLADEFGVEVEFRETTPICIERPTGAGSAIEVIGSESNRFLATVGLRIEPSAAGGGLDVRAELDIGSVPLYVYKSADAFVAALEEIVRSTLAQGLYGWEVTDCVVTLTHAGYSAPSTTAGDFKKLTPLVVIDALKQAGTEVCEPIHRFRLETPARSLQSALRLLGQLRAEPHVSTVTESSFALEGEIAAARMHLLQQQVGGATGGEGVLELAFSRYERVDGEVPRRPRSDFNPLNRDDYLLRLAGRVAI